jgi:hypothetical protein
MIQYRGIACVLIVSSGLLVGCEKKSFHSQPLASLQVINAVVGGGNIKLNNNQRDSVRMYNAKVFGLAILDGKTSIRVWPTNEFAKPYFNNIMEVEKGGIYSLFLFGQSGSVESLFIKEQIPGRYNDSVIGVRVAHLSPGSDALNITLKANPSTIIFQQIKYREVSGIVKIPLPNPVPAGRASFEIRDAASNKLLTTYVLPTSVNALYPGISISLQRFKNIMLVVKGSRDNLSGTNAIGVFPVAMSY